ESSDSNAPIRADAEKPQRPPDTAAPKEGKGWREIALLVVSLVSGLTAISTIVISWISNWRQKQELMLKEDLFTYQKEESVLKITQLQLQIVQLQRQTEDQDKLKRIIL